ncbi:MULTISPECIES: DUF349 domain-containing protein [Kocuria]|uniref:DUF349 domain-containing protein n=1 Tax=Kocuria TaxID=57493 RepID=UPI000B0C9DEA|nr:MULTISPECIES: DUF349 domain-containing protein [Kocuria]MCT1722580.1 DUF349 domain-containing protein [Kocuria marina]MCT1734883.1 DUF349 domain-containing protein [Kocuria marina]GHD86565.1 DNA repair ATPase [Kocuria marina]
MTERPESDDRRPVPGPATPAASAPKPAAPSTPKPTPSAAPAPAPAAAQPRPAEGTHAALAPADSVERARAFGRADENGTVYVSVQGTEYACGQFPDATPDEALAYFARKFDDAEAQVALLEQRIAAKAPAGDMRKTVDHVREQVDAHTMVGDLTDLSTRLDTLEDAIKVALNREREETKAAKAQQLAHRTAIVEAAEEVAAQDPAKTQWKHSSARMAELFSQWQDHQRSGGRLPKSDEDALWKRFRKARTTFDRHRKAFFSSLDETNAKAKRVKEGLIKEAEALSSSTEWGETAGKYRELMDRWKEAPRASRKEDDALWARFRAAQDAFFSARTAANERIDQEYAGNLTVKEQLLAEAKQILPVKDLDAAKKQLASVQQRWEEAGKVPRAHMRRVENELRAVEDAVKKAEDDRWRRTDPETKARSNSMLSQLENKIADQRAALEAARAGGNTKRAASLEKDLATSEQWLATLQASASELR